MVQLRALQADDESALLHLSRRAWTEVEEAVDRALGQPLDRLVTPSWEAHHEAVVREICRSDAVEGVVAVAETGEVVGFVASRVHPPSDGMSAYGQVEVIAVDPGVRDQGIGRALLDRAVATLRAAGVPVIMVETGGDEGHGPARALYEAAGFRRLSTAQYWLSGADPT